MAKSIYIKHSTKMEYSIAHIVRDYKSKVATHYPKELQHVAHEVRDYKAKFATTIPQGGLFHNYKGRILSAPTNCSELAAHRVAPMGTLTCRSHSSRLQIKSSLLQKLCCCELINNQCGLVNFPSAPNVYPSIVLFFTICPVDTSK